MRLCVRVEIGNVGVAGCVSGSGCGVGGVIAWKCVQFVSGCEFFVGRVRWLVGWRGCRVWGNCKCGGCCCCGTTGTLRYPPLLWVGVRLLVGRL